MLTICPWAFTVVVVIEPSALVDVVVVSPDALVAPELLPDPRPEDCAAFPLEGAERWPNAAEVEDKAPIPLMSSFLVVAIGVVVAIGAFAGGVPRANQENAPIIGAICGINCRAGQVGRQ
jgi:hypothetical protein